MQVKDVMEKEVIKVKRSTNLKQLLNLFKDFHTFPLVPVVESDDRLVGIVSFRNLIDVFRPKKPEILKAVPFLDEEKEDIFKVELTEEMGDLVLVEDIMERGFFTLSENLSLEEAYNFMRLHQKEQICVVDSQNRLVGIIGIFDIILNLFRQRGIVE